MLNTRRTRTYSAPNMRLIRADLRLTRADPVRLRQRPLTRYSGRHECSLTLLMPSSGGIGAPQFVWSIEQMAEHRFSLSHTKSGDVRNTRVVDWNPTWGELIAALSTPEPGPKDGPYFLRGRCEGRRSDAGIHSAELVILDADSRIDPSTGEITPGAPPFEQAADALARIGVDAILYTSHSHGAPGKGERYRIVVPCPLKSPEELEAAVGWLLSALHERGCFIAPVKENLAWSQPWYLPRVDPERAGLERFDLVFGGMDIPLADLQAEKAQAERGQAPRQGQDPDPLPPGACRPGPTAKPGDGTPIGRFLEENGSMESVLAMLERFGYMIKGTQKVNGEEAHLLLAPRSTSHQPGVHVYRHAGNGKVLVASHHGEHDPLAKTRNGKALAHDAFDVYTILEFGGDRDTALGTLRIARPEDFDAPDDWDKPRMAWREEWLPSVVDQAERVLLEAREPIYQRGGQLVRPVRLEGATEGDIRRPAGGIVLAPVSAAFLRDRLTDLVSWFKPTLEGEERDCACPLLVTETFLARMGAWRVPPLRAVVRAPLVTQKGRVLATPGFDAASGLLLDLDHADWPIPSDPTREAARAALERLVHLLRHFPFADDAARSVALSLLITPLVRPVLPAAPIHAVDAPEAGTGKSLLVDAAAILATGRPAAAMSYGRDPAEAAKRLDAALLSGDAFIALDNIEAPLEGDALCSTATQAERVIRPLGASTRVNVPMTAFIAATGNNLTLRGDITRRTLACRLDAETDRPELRRIDQDLLQECRDRRPELVADALTIILAYARAGSPDQGLSPLGSFGEWSRMVRSALVWAGLVDPVDVMAGTRANDPARETLGAVLTAWRLAYGDRPVTAAEAANSADSHEGLEDALLLAAGRSGRIDARALAYWLRDHNARRAGALVLRRVDAAGKINLVKWWVEGPKISARG
jgi:hypothetical protein